MSERLLHHSDVGADVEGARVSVDIDGLYAIRTMAFQLLAKIDGALGIEKTLRCRDQEELEKPRIIPLTESGEVLYDREWGRTISVSDNERGQPEPIEFTRTERIIFNLLIGQKGELVSFKNLWEAIYPDALEVDYLRWEAQKVVRPHITNIRIKLGKACPDHILAVDNLRSRGYYLILPFLEKDQENAE